MDGPQFSLLLNSIAVTTCGFEPRLESIDIYTGVDIETMREAMDLTNGLVSSNSNG